MQITNFQQTTAFLWAFVLGAGIAVIYTVIRSVRIVLPPTQLQLFAGDMLFMIFVCIVNTLYAISLTEGRIRLYFVFSELVGYILIYIFPGRFFIKGLIVVVRFLVNLRHNISEKIIIRIQRIKMYIDSKSRKNKMYGTWM